MVHHQKGPKPTQKGKKPAPTIKTATMKEQLDSISRKTVKEQSKSAGNKGGEYMSGNFSHVKKPVPTKDRIQKNDDGKFNLVSDKKLKDENEKTRWNELNEKLGLEVFSSSDEEDDLHTVQFDTSAHDTTNVESTKGTEGTTVAETTTVKSEFLKDLENSAGGKIEEDPKDSSAR